MANKNRRRQNPTNGFHQQNAETEATSTANAEASTTTTRASQLTTNGNHQHRGDNHEDNKDQGDSPLLLFSNAKDQINRVYQRIDECVSKASKFYSDNELDEEISANIDLERLKRLNKSIEIIRTVLSRNQMKVAFFGRTSNGKSTVINAILRDKVLPMGYGHTTGCFLQIQGNQQEDAFLEIQKSGHENERRPIQSVGHIANALNSGSLEYSTLVKIYWPIAKCPLLKYDVVLVDSPGVDVEENLDEWIDEHCHDADVFVLVSNAESTLNIAEKNFFHKVSEKLSKPNIFILNNRWDSIADDPDSIDQVREQHIDRAVHFLAEELKITSREEAKLKTFFVSARETLYTRAHKGNLNDSATIRPGYEDRCREFEEFERGFEESLSKSAVRTKFKKHTDKGDETIQELNGVLKSTQMLVYRVSQKRQDELQEKIERCRNIENLFCANEFGLEKQIHDTREMIQIMTDTEFDNEIRRLSHIVEDFDLQFSPNPIKLSQYKEQLYLHVEESLSENLRSRINTVINKHVNPFSKAMSDLSALLSEERQQKIKSMVVSQTYVPDDLINLSIYRQFYTEFQEDLEFRFSFGLVNIIRRFQGRFSSNKRLNSSSLDQSRGLHTSMSNNTDVLSILEKFMMNPPQSPTTVGSLAIGGVLVRTVGWKVIIVTTAVYGALYAYEYLTWTNSAKERSFKSQYVRHAKKGLQDCAPIISQHIANSIEQKMVGVFGKVRRDIDAENSEVKASIGILERSLEKLKICDEFTRELLGENDILMNELLAFAKTFLS